jgi:ABC-type transport system involved in multi-copper enzyme maturation permease subunit
VIFLRVLSSELLKMKRSPITWVLPAVYCLAPWMMGLMMAVLKNPELGRRLGLITAKAQMTVGTADWPTYLMLSTFLFAGGMIVLAIADAFLFGREYAEGTAKNMLTLPVDRASFVAAKLAVSALWFLGMAGAVYAESLLIGVLLRLPGYSAGLLAAQARQAATVALLAFLVSPAIAWIAVASRGYLAPIGVSILLFLLGDLFGHTGWGQWFPWSIVLMAAGAGGNGVAAPGAASMAVALAFFFAAAAAAYLTLDRADNTQ